VTFPSTGPAERNLACDSTLSISGVEIHSSQDAIVRVYRDSGTQLWRGVYAYSGGRRDIADDAVAEAFARALEHAERIRSPLPWLYRVAFRQAARRMREEGQQGAIPAEFESESLDELTPHQPLGALALLAPHQRAVVFLFYYADLSIADIARATGSSRVAVRVQLHRSREALRRRYGSAAAMREWSSPGGSDEHELV
jgi:RNA polymerase sigma factor (sigma-70 family)